MNSKLIKFSKHRASGQAIAEGTAFLCIFVMVAVGLFMLILNTCVFGGYDYKMRIAAEQTAKTVGHLRYWLGMRRDDFNVNQQNELAQSFAKQALAQMGIPAALANTATVDVSYPMYQINNVINVPVNVETVKVVITVNGLQALGGVFRGTGQNGGFTMSATGVSMEDDLPPYAMGIQTFTDPATNITRSVRYPIYSARKSSVSPTGEVTWVANGSSEGYNPAGWANLGHVTGPFTTVCVPNLVTAPGATGSIFRVRDGEMVTQRPLNW